MNSVLLISDGNPSEDSLDPNEILLRFFFTSVEDTDVLRFILSIRSEHNMPDSWLGFRYIVYRRKSAFINHKYGSLLNGILNFLSNLHITIIETNYLFNKLNSVYKGNHFDKIVVVATSPQIISIASRFCKKVKIPIYTIIWDTPEQFSLDLRIPPVFRRKILRGYNYLLSKSLSYGVASDELGRYLSNKFGKKAFLMQGDVVERKDIISTVKNNDNRIIIGFAGTQYAYEAWDALFKALETLDWKYDGKPIFIRIIGTRFNIVTNNKCNIEYLGAQKVPEALSILSDSDINFIPYRFNNQSNMESRFSFPSKLNTYLSASRPLFAIAPDYSSVNNFIVEEEIGICCNTLIPENIADSLCRILSDQAMINEYILNIKRIYENKFSPEKLSERFSSFLEIPTRQ